MKDAHDLFTEPVKLEGPDLPTTIRIQTQLCYELLHQGRLANVALKPEVREKLMSSYMEIGKDPWKQDYLFFLGPMKTPVNARYLRSYRGRNYVYDQVAFEMEQKTTQGNPVPEANLPPAKGYPCPPDLPLYIFSCGKNKTPDQLPWGGDGGDDINNWDSNQGCAELYP